MGIFETEVGYYPISVTKLGNFRRQRDRFDRKREREGGNKTDTGIQKRQRGKGRETESERE